MLKRYAGGAAARRAASGLPPGPALDEAMMTKAELCNHHEREAARLRSLLAGATTAGTKAWLARQVEEHDRLAKGESEDFELETAS